MLFDMCAVSFVSHALLLPTADYRSSSCVPALQQLHLRQSGYLRRTSNALPQGQDGVGGEPEASISSSASTQAPIKPSTKGLAAVPPLVDVYGELLGGALWRCCQQVNKSFSVPWGPAGLVKVMAGGLGLLVALGAAAASLPGTGNIAATVDNSDHGILSSLAAAAASDPFTRIFLQELLFALAIPGLLFLCLRDSQPLKRGFFALQWDATAAGQVLLLCLALFPLVDPLLVSLWSPAVEAVTGLQPTAAAAAAADLRAVAVAGNGGALARAFAASAFLGPLWEEVFYRGFFLSSLTRVLPLPAAVGTSAVTFAALHTSPHAFLPLVVLGAACDVLYLRTRNLAAPLVLHAAWNGSQLAAICWLGKETFV